MRLIIIFGAALLLTLQFLEFGAFHGLMAVIMFGIGLGLSRLT